MTKKIFFAIALLLFLGTGCIPNSPYMQWHGQGISDLDSDNAHRGARPTDEAWCAQPFAMGGDGKIEVTTVSDALTRSYICYPTQIAASDAWERDRATYMDWRNTTSS